MTGSYPFSKGNIGTESCLLFQKDFLLCGLNFLRVSFRQSVPVRGSYSARVPRSSSTEVHREFVHHIVEEEADGQEEKQNDRRESGQQEEESGEVVENQTHNMSA